MHISNNNDHPNSLVFGFVILEPTITQALFWGRDDRYLFFFKLHYKNVYLRKASFTNDIKSALTYSYNMSGMSSFNLTNVCFLRKIKSEFYLVVMLYYVSHVYLSVRNLNVPLPTFTLFNDHRFVSEISKSERVLISLVASIVWHDSRMIQFCSGKNHYLQVVFSAEC